MKWQHDKNKDQRVSDIPPGYILCLLCAKKL